MKAWHRFREDFRRYVPPGGVKTLSGKLRVMIDNEALWAIAVFRFGQYLREEAGPLVRALAKVPFAIAHRAVRLGLGVHLFPQTRIGPGLYIGHFGGVWISPFAQIGAHCNINHETTIGVAGGRTAPVLEDRVWVGPNSTVSGPIRVQTGAVIGANSLVVANVAKDAVVLGVPARAVSYSGSAQLLDPKFVDVDTPAAG